MYNKNDELNKELLAECSFCKRDGFPHIELKSGKKGHSFEERAPSVVFVFILDGEIAVTSGSAVDKPAAENHFFLLPSEAQFKITFLTDANLAQFFLTDDIFFCEKYRQGTLSKIYENKKLNFADCDVFLLKTNKNINNLLSETIGLINNFYCPYYIKCKTDEFLILLGLYYSGEDLAQLYQPVIRGNIIFRSVIMHYRNKIFTVNEFADIIHLNKDTFRRHFKEVFGIGPSKWIQQQRAELILEELKKNRPIVSVMDRCGFSFHSDFTRFCKKHLNNTPQMLQKQFKYNKTHTVQS